MIEEINEIILSNKGVSQSRAIDIYLEQNQSVQEESNPEQELREDLERGALNYAAVLTPQDIEDGTVIGEARAEGIAYVSDVVKNQRLAALLGTRNLQKDGFSNVLVERLKGMNDEELGKSVTRSVSSSSNGYARFFLNPTNQAPALMPTKMEATQVIDVTNGQPTPNSSSDEESDEEE